MASGTRILLNLHRCRGPVTTGGGFNLTELVRALQGAGMKVLNASMVPYPDETVNFHLDLGESHFSGGVYLAERHVAAELNVCNESADNQEKAKAAAKAVEAYFNPEESDMVVLPWASR